MLVSVEVIAESEAVTMLGKVKGWKIFLYESEIMVGKNGEERETDKITRFGKLSQCSSLMLAAARSCGVM